MYKVFSIEFLFICISSIYKFYSKEKFSKIYFETEN